MNIEKRIERAIVKIGQAFRPVEVWVTGNGILVDPKHEVYFGQLVGVYDVRKPTWDGDQFAQDVFTALGGA